jgi:hypothetical protein
VLCGGEKEEGWAVVARVCAGWVGLGCAHGFRPTGFKGVVFGFEFEIQIQIHPFESANLKSKQVKCQQQIQTKIIRKEFLKFMIFAIKTL